MISDEVAVSMLSRLAPVVTGRVTADQRVVDVSGALLDQLGHRAVDWVGRALRDVITDRTILHVVRRALDGAAEEATTVLNGRTWLVAAQPVRSGGARVSGAVVVMTYAYVGAVHRELTAQEALSAQFAALSELSKDFISIADLDGTVTYLNRAGRELVGLHTDQETLGRPALDYVAEQARERSQEMAATVRSTGSWQGESRLRHFATGQSIPVSVDSFLVHRSSDGRPLALATVQRDLRARVRSQELLSVRVQEQRALTELGRLALTEPLGDLMDEAVRLVNARYPSHAAGVLQRMPDGERMQMVAATRPHWRDVRVDIDQATLSGRSLLENALLSTDDIAADDRFGPHSSTTLSGLRSVLCCPIPGEPGPWGVVGCYGTAERCWSEDDLAFVDSVAATLGAAVRRDELEARLRHQALHDPLTGLPNRALVLDRIAHALRRPTRRGSLLAVLLLDVDDFKAVNDTLGHSRGDELLTDLGLRLECAVRPGDTVARFGGDEFVVVCEEPGSDDEVAFVAEALLQAAAGGVEIEGHRLSLSCSVGVALCRDGRGTATSLLSEADIAMHRAKRDRPGTYRIFDEPMRGDVLDRITVAGELRTAVRAGGLGIAYQPIVHLGTGRVVAMEALARWTNEAGAVIAPDVFIPVAEETGLIGELGSLILRGALQDAVVWQQFAPIGVRVNASAHQLRSHLFFDQVTDSLRDVGLEPELLGIEITESVLVAEDRVTQENLTRLRAAGVSLLIDDFGTGYSSLSYLQRFPVVDVLKVDRSFLGEGTRGEAVVQAVIGLGRAFGLQVCAEGVETPEQLARVRELGCDFAQGYLLGRPVPSAQALDVLATWQPVPAPGA